MSEPTFEFDIVNPLLYPFEALHLPTNFQNEKTSPGYMRTLFIFGPESAMAAGYVNDGVLTKTKEESGLASITYTSGNLVLSESYSSVYGKVYIMYQ